MGGLATFASPTPRAVDPMPEPRGASSLLLGREQEITELDDALGLAADGTPQVVLVGGDAGIGKTALVTDLGRRASGLGFTVATGHSLDIEAGMSFAPVIEAMRSLLSGIEDFGPRPSARRMLTLLDPDTPRSPEALHVLDDLTAAFSKQRPPVHSCWCSRICTGRTARPRTSRLRCLGPPGVVCCW